MFNATTARRSSRPSSRFLSSLATLGLVAALTPTALAAPPVQLTVSSQKLPSPILSPTCCYTLTLGQQFGSEGHIASVSVTPMTSGVTVTSASASTSGPSTIAGNVATWLAPTTTNLDEDVQVCFGGASGDFVVKVVAVDKWGNSGFKMSHYLYMECNCGCVVSGSGVAHSSPVNPSGVFGGIPAGPKTPASGTSGPIIGGTFGQDLSGAAPFADMWQDSTHALFLAIGDPDGIDDVDMNSIFVAFDGVPMPAKPFLALFKADDRGNFYQIKKSTQIPSIPGQPMNIQIAVRDLHGNFFMTEIDYIGM